MKNYCDIKNLKPIKIFCACEFRNQSAFYEQLSQHYQVSLINAQNFLRELKQLEQFRRLEQKFLEPENELVDKLDDPDFTRDFFNFFDPQKPAEQIYLSLLKVRLLANDCRFKGFILFNADFLVSHDLFKLLFYINDLSVITFKSRLDKNLAQRNRDIEKQKRKEAREEK